MEGNYEEVLVVNIVDSIVKNYLLKKRASSFTDALEHLRDVVYTNPKLSEKEFLKIWEKVNYAPEALEYVLAHVRGLNVPHLYIYSNKSDEVLKAILQYLESKGAHRTDTVVLKVLNSYLTDHFFTPHLGSWISMSRYLGANSEADTSGEDFSLFMRNINISFYNSGLMDIFPEVSELYEDFNLSSMALSLYVEEGVVELAVEIQTSFYGGEIYFEQKELVNTSSLYRFFNDSRRHLINFILELEDAIL